MRKRILACTVLFCLSVYSAKLVCQTQPVASASGAAGAPISPASSATSSGAALPDPKTPQEFFVRARQLSDLEASGIPFHLKATYVASGDAEFTGNGTYEEWWQSRDLWRKEATLGGYKYVEIESGGKQTVYASSDYIPLRLRQAMGTSLIHFSHDVGAAGIWKMQHKQVDGTALTLISSKPCKDVKYAAHCGIEDYFTSGGVLRIRMAGSVETIYNGWEPFQNLLIARKIATAAEGTAILTISVQSIELLKSNEAELLKNAAPPTKLQPLQAAVDMRNKPAPQPKASKIIHIVQPIYPFEAKYRGVEGTVVLDVMIDETGEVREPFVVYSAGAMLDKSALDAVRQWRYLPTVLNGSPVCVHTRISIVFRLGH